MDFDHFARQFLVNGMETHARRPFRETDVVRDGDGQFAEKPASAGTRTVSVGIRSGGRWPKPELQRTIPDGSPILTPTYMKQTEKRKAWRNDVIDGYLDGLTPPEGRKPKITFMGGGGASGKGVIKNRKKEGGLLPTENILDVDPDHIKENHTPEFKDIVARGDSRAAEVTHKESSDMAWETRNRARKRGLDVINDGTMGNIPYALEELRDFKEEGYDIDLVAVTKNPVVAVEHNAKRAGEQGRHVPEEVQLTAHRSFSEGFEQYVELADTVELWDMDEPEPRLIAVKERGGKLEVLDEGLFEAFKRKASLNPKAQGPDELYS